MYFFHLSFPALNMVREHVYHLPDSIISAEICYLAIDKYITATTYSDQDTSDNQPASTLVVWSKIQASSNLIWKIPKPCLLDCPLTVNSLITLGDDILLGTFDCIWIGKLENNTLTMRELKISIIKDFHITKLRLHKQSQSVLCIGSDLTNHYVIQIKIGKSEKYEILFCYDISICDAQFVTNTENLLITTDDCNEYNVYLVTHSCKVTKRWKLFKKCTIRDKILDIADDGSTLLKADYDSALLNARGFEISVLNIMNDITSKISFMSKANDLKYLHACFNNNKKIFYTDGMQVGLQQWQKKIQTYKEMINRSENPRSYDLFGQCCSDGMNFANVWRSQDGESQGVLYFDVQEATIPLCYSQRLVESNWPSRLRG